MGRLREKQAVSKETKAGGERERGEREREREREGERERERKEG